jgi:hypothetical protein
VKRLAQSQTGLTLRSALWSGLVLMWLAFLLRGVWWIWPAIARMELTEDLVAGLLWRIPGALAWAWPSLWPCRQRYWPQATRK